MPRDGKLHSLIPEDGIVKFGVPIASYETAMLDALKGHLNNEDLSTNKIAELFNQTLTGTISSPCDCILQNQLVVDGQFSSKGTTAFKLVPNGAKPFIDAQFNLKDSQNVAPGRPVTITIPGLSESIKGQISDVTVSTTGTSLAATIQLHDDVPLNLIGRPALVVISDMMTNDTPTTATVAGLNKEL